MGVHDERTLRSLPLFEAELCRRLWSQVLLINECSGKHSGERALGTRSPSNCNDSDLSPFMVRIPEDQEGGTDMLFCTLHTHFRTAARILRRHANDEKLLPIELDVLEEFETKIDRLTSRCDPSIPLHLFTILVGRCAIARLQFSVTANAAFAEHDDLSSMPVETRISLLDSAITVLGFDCEIRSSQTIRPFLWHPVVQFPFDAFIYILTSLCTGTEGNRHNAAWVAVNRAYEDYPEFCADSDNPLFSAAGDLAIEAWDMRMDRVRAMKPMQMADPDMYPPGSIEYSAASHAISKLKEGRARVRNSLESARGTWGGMDEGSDEEVDEEDEFEFSWNDWQRLLQDAGYLHIGRTY